MSNTTKKEAKEILIYGIPIETFESELIKHIENIVVFGYGLTGRKFSVSFNGSKGYISSLEVSCEGEQKGINCVDITEFPTQDLISDYPKNMFLACFHSENEGVRLEIINNKEFEEIEKKQDNSLKFST